MKTFKQYLNESAENGHLSRAKRKLIEDALNSGQYKMTMKPESIQLFHEHKRTGRIERGLEIFNNGTAFDITANLSEAKIIRTAKDIRGILKL